MRLIAPRNAGPASVNRYLLPHEHQVITVRSHPGVLLGAIVLVVGGLVAAVALSIFSDFSSSALEIIWLVWGLLLLRLAWKTWAWSEDYFVVTSDRMLVISGVLARDLAMIPLALVAGVRLRRPMMGRIIGYGQLIVESAVPDQALRRLNFLPYPEQLYLEIIALIFPGEKIPCPQCDGQGILIQRNENGEETVYLCPLCKGRNTISGDSMLPESDSLPAESRDLGDD